MDTSIHFSSEILYDGIDCSISLAMQDNNIKFTLNKPLDSTFWETEISYKLYIEENPFLLLMKMKIDKFFEYVQNSIDMKQFNIKNNQKTI